MSFHNFADDNTLPSFAKIVNNLVSSLESESYCTINRFRDNSMILNPGKFEAILLDKIINEKYDNYFPPQLIAYGASYSTQHVL